MRIVIFGATGRTGRHLLEQSLAQGHQVTAFVRNPAALAPLERLTILTGDLLNSAQVVLAVKGQDAVLSVLGGSRKATIRGQHSGPSYIRTTATERILDAMENLGVRRFICQSAYGVGEDKNRSLYAIGAWLMAKEGFEDTERQERLIKQCSLDWIIVRAARLTDEPKRGVYRAGVGLRVGPFARISRADAADFMLKQLTDNTYIHKTPTIRY